MATPASSSITLKRIISYWTTCDSSLNSRLGGILHSILAAVFPCSARPSAPPLRCRSVAGRRPLIGRLRSASVPEPIAAPERPVLLLRRRRKSHHQRHAPPDREPAGRTDGHPGDGTRRKRAAPERGGGRLDLTLSADVHGFAAETLRNTIRVNGIPS